MTTATAPSTQKEKRLAQRWIPKNPQSGTPAEEFKHPDGVTVAYLLRWADNNYQACGYWGTAGKPSFNYSYKSREQAEKRIREFFDSVTARAEHMKTRRANRKVEAEQPIKPNDYVPVAKCAALIRAALKTKFPNVKFSVRSDSYSMGASVDVYWTDGPTKKEVEQITEPFEGSGFDGMIDLKYSVRSWLMPDGTAAFGRSEGTGNSHGSDPAYDNPQPYPDAIMVHFGSDYVHLHRSHSLKELERVARSVSERHGMAMPQIKTNSDGSAYLSTELTDLRDLIYRELEAESIQCE